MNGKREEVRQRLNEMGIGTMVYYPIPMHKLPMYAHGRWRLPLAEKLATEVISLPIRPTISAESQKAVVETLIAVLG